MMFNDDDTYKFYKRYTCEVEFSLKRYKDKTCCKWLNCSREDKCATREDGNPEYTISTLSGHSAKQG